MANRAKNADRKAKIEQMRREQRRKEQLRSYGILGVCGVLVVALLGFAVYKYVDDKREQDRLAGQPLEKIGVGRDAAGCSAIKTENATGNQDHVAEPTPIRYPDAPPAFGSHRPNFLQGSEIKTFYTRSDVPDITRLVHSLEHGYTILWYDDDVKEGSKEYQALQSLGNRLSVSDKFMAAPYVTKDDGGTFPSGKSVALTHWTGPSDQKGAWEYCSGVSGAVVADFMKTYDKDDAPEPGGI